MKDKHESELLNSYCGKMVKITYKDNRAKVGVLKPVEFGFGYKLLMLDGNTTTFAKSIVKKIEEVKK